MTGILKSFATFSITGVVLGAWGGAGVARAQMASAAEDPSLASPAMAVALPTTEPSAGEAGSPDGRHGDSNRHGGGFRGQGWFGGMGGGGMGSPGGMGANGNGGAGDAGSSADMPDGAEWQQISTFMTDHSPRRWAFYNRLPDGPRQHGMMRVATRAFRNLQKAQQDDPKLAAVMIQSVEAQDAVFGLVMDIRTARRNGDSDKVKALTGDLPAKVGTLVDVSFKERQLRVDQLQKTLDDLKTHLVADQKNRDTVISDRVRSLNVQHAGGPPGSGDGNATGASTASPGPEPVTVELDAPH